MSQIESKIVHLLSESPDQAVPLIFEHYGDALFGLIVRVVGNSFHAEEVLQDCLVKYWEKAHTYDPSKAKLFTWLYRIARNKAIDFVRV
ncbi:MAG: RNA polymerase sigma factor, partial [Flavobacteriales bacterium]|nr:RNA polymerase sigma factor [Flavobacteriales bacterium]